MKVFKPKFKFFLPISPLIWAEECSFIASITVESLLVCKLYVPLFLLKLKLIPLAVSDDKKLLAFLLAFGLVIYIVYVLCEPFSAVTIILNVFVP